MFVKFTDVLIISILVELTNKSFGLSSSHISQLTQVKHLLTIIVLCVNFNSEMRNIVMKET